MKQFCFFSLVYFMNTALNADKSPCYNLQLIYQHKITDISPTVVLLTEHLFFQPILTEELTLIEI